MLLPVIASAIASVIMDPILEEEVEEEVAGRKFIFSRLYVLGWVNSHLFDTKVHSTSKFGSKIKIKKMIDVKTRMTSVLKTKLICIMKSGQWRSFRYERRNSRKKSDVIYGLRLTKIILILTKRQWKVARLVFWGLMISTILQSLFGIFH